MRVRLTKEFGNSIAIIKFDIVKEIVKTENWIESKLKVVKILLENYSSFTLSRCLKIIHSQAINLFMLFLYLYPIKKFALLFKYIYFQTIIV